MNCRTTSHFVSSNNNVILTHIPFSIVHSAPPHSSKCRAFFVFGIQAQFRRPVLEVQQPTLPEATDVVPALVLLGLPVRNVEAPGPDVVARRGQGRRGYGEARRDDAIVLRSAAATGF
jgi:hypothetical protein